MRRSRTVGWIVAAASLVVVLISVIAMSRRVREFNERAHFPHYRFDVSTSRQFQVFGRPVSIQDAQEDGRSMLRVTYGGVEKLVPVVPPPAPDVPELGIYTEWVKVIEVHELERSPAGEQVDKPGAARLALVCRVPPEGYDPATWGTVRRADWTFQFHEFAEDGTIKSSTFRWPRSELGEMGLKKEVEKGDEAAKVLATIPRLPERTWEYQAALHVIPKLNVPQYRFQDTAMKAMGWTLPVAGFGVLGFMIGVGLGLAPKRTPKNGAEKSPRTQVRGL